MAKPGHSCAPHAANMLHHASGIAHAIKLGLGAHAIAKLAWPVGANPGLSAPEVSLSLVVKASPSANVALGPISPRSFTHPMLERVLMLERHTIGQQDAPASGAHRHHL